MRVDDECEMRAASCLFRRSSSPLRRAIPINPATSTLSIKHYPPPASPLPPVTFHRHSTSLFLHLLSLCLFTCSSLFLLVFLSLTHIHTAHLPSSSPPPLHVSHLPHLSCTSPLSAPFIHLSLLPPLRHLFPLLYHSYLSRFSFLPFYFVLLFLLLLLHYSSPPT